MNAYENLQRLEQLRQQGILTQEEFEQEKRRLLDSLHAPQQQTPPPPPQNQPNSSRRATNVLDAPLGADGYDPLVDARQNSGYALALHLILFVPYIGWLITLIMWLVKKNESPLINQHGSQTTNLLISQIIYGLIALVLIAIMAGTAGNIRRIEDNAPVMVILVLLGLFWLIFMILTLVFIIVNAVRAGNGKPASYPLAIPFIKAPLPEAGTNDITQHFGR